MKKSLLGLLLAVAMVVPALADNMWVSGSLGYSSNNLSVEYRGENESIDSFTSWSIQPEFGYSINEKWDLGLDLAYSSGQGVNDIYGFSFEGMLVDTTELGIAPFARYHVAKIAGIDVILKGSIFYATGTAKAYGDSVDYKAYGITVVPVVSYSINEKWSVDATLNFASLGYSHAEMDIDGITPKSDQFGLNVNNGSIANVGVSYHF